MSGKCKMQLFRSVINFQGNFNQKFVTILLFIGASSSSISPARQPRSQTRESYCMRASLFFTTGLSIVRCFVFLQMNPDGKTTILISAKCNLLRKNRSRVLLQFSITFVTAENTKLDLHFEYFRHYRKR